MGYRIIYNGYPSKCYYFLSTRRQAYSDGMGFVQFYLGLPIAMVIISIFFLPLYYKARVYTAYEFLESRFDVKTRMLSLYFSNSERAGSWYYCLCTSHCFINTIGFSLQITCIIIGVLVIIYTVSGGTEAHKHKTTNGCDDGRNDCCWNFSD